MLARTALHHHIPAVFVTDDVRPDQRSLYRVRATSTAVATHALPVPGPQRYGESYKVVSIDAEAKVARLACGSEIAYDALINTAPLDITLRWLGQPKWADTLSHRRAITACFGCSAIL